MAASQAKSLQHIAILGSRGFPSTYGGYETLVRYLARDWVSKGIEVTVYCRTRSGSVRAWTTEGVKCRWTPGYDSNSLSTLTYGASSHLDAAFRGFDAALVLNVANGFWLPALRRASIPMAVNTDGIEWERGKWGRFARRAFYTGAKIAAAYADVLICDSRAIGDIWKSEFGVTSEFVPYGAPVVRVVATDRIAALALPRRPYALVVGRIIPENNIDLILDAIEARPKEIFGVVVGSASSKSSTADRLRRLDETGVVRWLGHVNDQELLLQLWAHSGVYLHGHSVGGTNPGLLQALGAGAPTLAFDTVFNREVMCDFDESQFFGSDPGALASQIVSVLGDEELRSKLAEDGRATVAARYDWSDVSDRYLAVLGLAQARASGMVDP
jgi:glycosyltransferase involved in cell wall biosynthesis